MAKKTGISQEDMDAFHKAVEGTKPLVQKKVRISPPPPKRTPVKRQKTTEEVFNLTEIQAVDEVGSEEFIAFKQNSISNKMLRKLRKGQYNVDAVLDLHGMSVEKAKTAVETFLQQCLHEGMRVALIIHGKGHHSPMPILKNKLNRWLRETNVVLAFCSAAPTHGSRGAMYVLLKRTAEENAV